MPRIISAAQIGLRFDALFGPLGVERNVTGHYTAGPRDANDQDAIRLCRQYHAQHRSQGWGGIGYHFCITKKGTVIGLRPTGLKGAHTGGHNSQNLGVMMHGGPLHKPTRAQARSYRWLLANAHTGRMPSAHRTDVDLRKARKHGHNSWSGHYSNGCPGKFKTLYMKGYR